MKVLPSKPKSISKAFLEFFWTCFAAPNKSLPENFDKKIIFYVEFFFSWQKFMVFCFIVAIITWILVESRFLDHQMNLPKSKEQLSKL